MARPAPRHVRPDAPAVAPDEPVTIRFLAPDEAEALTAAIVHSYGDTYDCRWVYDPAEVRRRLSSGTLRSIVGEHQDRVVGHLGLSRRDPDAPVGEAGQAVVDPAFRGHHLFETLKRTLAVDCRDRGLLGMYSEATAAHPYSQKANLTLGACETGFLLGYIPGSVTYTDIEPQRRAPRLSVALFYLSTTPDPGQVLHAPSWHRTMVAEIADHNRLPREIAEPDSFVLDGTTELAVDLRADHGEAFVTVGRLGVDLVAAIADTTRRAVEEDACDCVYLDLPLADPATAALPLEIHDELGYFFGGVVPHLANGDVLRLQYLHDVEADASDVAVASDFGARLLAYVFERRRIPADV